MLETLLKFLMNDDCIFCRIIKGQIPAAITYEDEVCVAFNDIKPRAPYHLLFVPRRHIDRVSSVLDSDEMMLGHLVNVARKYAKKLKIDHYRLQFNCGEKGGQEVFHVHLHLMGWQ